MYTSKKIKYNTIQEKLKTDYSSKKRIRCSCITLILFTGTWIVKDIKPNTDGKAQKVKVKVRVNLHGIMTVSSASLYEAKDSSPDQEQMENGDAPQREDGAKNGAEGGNEADAPMTDGNGSQNTDGAQQQPAEVGSGVSWTKKISGWFSGVRIQFPPLLAG